MRISGWEVPDKVRRNALALGEAGRCWLAELPQRLDELERRWEITAGAPLGRGSEALVAEARTADGRDAILKIAIPGVDPARQEIRILRTAGGAGYARLIRADETQNAMLLEKLGPQLHERQLPEAEKLRIICATLRLAWALQSSPPGPPLVTAAEKAAEFSRVIAAQWEPLGRPCSERAATLALTYAERRRSAFDPARCVVAHGDAHEWNTLLAPASTTGFKFVDPDGVFAERAFDLAIPMREWGGTIPVGDRVELGRRRCALLAGFADVDPRAIREWALVQCVWNGLLLYRLGQTQPATAQLAMADAWAAAAQEP